METDKLQIADVLPVQSLLQLEEVGEGDPGGEGGSSGDGEQLPHGLWQLEPLQLDAQIEQELQIFRSNDWSDLFAQKMSMACRRSCPECSRSCLYVHPSNSGCPHNCTNPLPRYGFHQGATMRKVDIKKGGSVELVVVFNGAFKEYPPQIMPQPCIKHLMIPETFQLDKFRCSVLTVVEHSVLPQAMFPIKELWLREFPVLLRLTLEEMGFTHAAITSVYTKIHERTVDAFYSAADIQGKNPHIEFDERYSPVNCVLAIISWSGNVMIAGKLSNPVHLFGHMDMIRKSEIPIFIYGRKHEKPLELFMREGDAGTRWSRGAYRDVFILVAPKDVNSEKLKEIYGWLQIENMGRQFTRFDGDEVDVGWAAIIHGDADD